MKNKKHIRRAALLAAVGVLEFAGSSLAATNTWTGGGNGSHQNHWNDSSNWSGNVPGSSDDVVLTGSGNSRPTDQNISSLSIISLTFNNTTTTAFTVSGNPFTLTSSATALTVNTSAANHTIGVDVTLGASQSWDIGGSVTLTESGNILESGGARGLTKTGTGTLLLTGTGNAYTGLTTISAGTLAYGVSNAISTGAVTVNGAAAILDLGASHSDSVGTVTVAGGGSITGTGTSALTSTGTFEMQSGSVTAILAGSGIALNKTTSGTVTLSGANTYTGLTTVSAGTLAYGASNAISTGAVTVNGGTAILALGANRSDTVGTVTLDGGGQITGSGTSTLTSTGTFEMKSGSVTAILGGSGIALNKTTSGTVTLSGANTYTGLTTVSAGTLAYGASNVLSTGAVTVDGATAILALGANQSDSVGTVTLDNGGQITGSGTSTLTSTGTFEMKSGSVTAILGGSGIALNKTTSGTVTLSGAHTYTGATTIGGGTLVVSGSLSASSAVAVNSGGTLAGTGNAAGAVSVNTGGTISPGSASTGTLTTGAQTWSGGGSYVWEINNSTGTYGGASGWDKISMGGLTVSATSGNTFTIKVVGTPVNFDNQVDKTWAIATHTGGLVFDATKFSLDASGFTNALKPGWGFTVEHSGQDVQVHYHAVPEPSSIMLLATAAGGLLMRRKRA